MTITQSDSLRAQAIPTLTIPLLNRNSARTAAIPVALLILLVVALGACGNPLSDESDATDTATLPTPTEAPDATTPPADNTATEEATETAEAGIATLTMTTAPGASTEDSTASASAPTLAPLPASGAEFTIEGHSIIRIIPGSASGSTLYAVAGERLWRTDDGGTSWVAAGDGDIGEAVVALNAELTIYTGDRGTCGRGFSFHELRSSVDGGNTWETIEAHPDMEPLLAYESDQTGIVYGTNCGLSVSDDRGATWVAIPDLNGEDVFAVATERNAPMEQIITVAATEGGTGRLFLLDTSNPAQPQFEGALTQFWGDAAIDWSDGRIVVAHAHQVGVSDDNGETWQWSRDGLEEATFSVDPLFESIPTSELDPFRRFTATKIDPTNRDRIWIGGTLGAFLSVDGGQTWERVGDAVEITGIAIAPASERVIVSSTNGARIWNLDAS